jgi:hypothetical protein
MVALLMNLTSNTYHSIQRNILNNYPTEALLHSVLSGSILIVFFCSLFINMERRLRFPSIVEVITGTGKYRFYAYNPEDFQMMINRNLQEN